MVINNGQAEGEVMLNEKNIVCIIHDINLLIWQFCFCK